MFYRERIKNSKDHFELKFEISLFKVLFLLEFRSMSINKPHMNKKQKKNSNYVKIVIFYLSIN